VVEVDAAADVDDTCDHPRASCDEAVACARPGFAPSSGRRARRDRASRLEAGGAL
jgi:hypothetical protein